MKRQREKRAKIEIERREVKISDGITTCGKRMIYRFVCLLGCALFFFSACVPQNVFLSPPADQIEEIEGFASLRLTTAQQTTRSRVSFLFLPPAKGRIDVLDPLGQVHYQLFIVDDLAYFIVPEKKAYWQGREEDLMSQLFGFHLTLLDVIGLMSGYWPDAVQRAMPSGQDSWTYRKNTKGWIRSGQRGEFFFSVQEYFGQTQWVKEVLFFHPQTEGRLKILDVHFNKPVSEMTFSTSFSSRYSKMTWEEIREIISRAR